MLVPVELQKTIWQLASAPELKSRVICLMDDKGQTLPVEGTATTVPVKLAACTQGDGEVVVVDAGQTLVNTIVNDPAMLPATNGLPELNRKVARKSSVPIAVSEGKSIGSLSGQFGACGFVW